MQRRKFLQLSAVTAIAIALSPTSLLSDTRASGDGYKALVCVFLFGGMDNYDTILPYDESEYQQYASIRQTLLSGYNGARSREKLLKLQATNANNFNGREFAMPAEFKNVARLFNEGKAAVVGNVGPLIKPLTRAIFDEEGLDTPKRLFSHNDQQATWMSNAPEGSRYGWGGSFCDALRTMNTNHDFSAITTNGSRLFLSGEKTSPYQISSSGAIENWLLDDLEDNSFSQRVKEHTASSNYIGTNILVRDMIKAQQGASKLNAQFSTAIKNVGETSATFAKNKIAQQLKAVVNTIKTHGSLSVSRQVFIVGQGGYDTHDSQAIDLPVLQKNLDNAIGAFYEELEASGLQDQVTLFSASEFGRTLSVNGDGTDHGWGGHQIVVGGSVNGAVIYGDIPPIEYEHDHDAGDGRLIPSISVEQYASPIARWFGLSESDLNNTFKNIAKFDTTMNFMKS